MSAGDIHDQFFKRVLTDTRRAMQFFQAVLTPALTETLDWSKFRPEKISYADKQLRSKHSDILYSLPFLSTLVNNQELRFFLFLRIEHQSSRDRFMPVRALGYDVRLWEHALRPKVKPPFLMPVLPIVLCHAKGGWKGPVEISDLFAIPKGLHTLLEPYIPKRQFLLIDLTAKENPFDIENPPGTALDAYMKLVLGMLRDLRFLPNIEEWLMQWKPRFIEFWASQPNQDEIIALEHYFLLAQNQVNAEHFEEFMSQHVDPQAAKAFKSAGQQLIEQGKLEGRREGKLEERIELLTKQFSRRLKRPLTESELATLTARIEKEGPDPASEALFDLSLEQLVQWLAAVPGLSLPAMTTDL